MKKENHIKSAASQDAGNLVNAWLAYAANPGNQKALDELGRACAEHLQSILPAGSGLFSDIKNESVQDALILLIGKYLAGNQLLQETTADGDTEAILRELKRSTAAAASIASSRLKRRRVQDTKERDEFREEHGGKDVHISRRQHWRELPVDLQVALALTAVDVALAGGLISDNAAAAIRIMLAEGSNIPETAKAIGKSRQAVHQWLAKARKPLNRVMNNLEFPGL